MEEVVEKVKIMMVLMTIGSLEVKTMIRLKKDLWQQQIRNTYFI